jgi:phospholipid transport system substrate-binding protein
MTRGEGGWHVTDVSIDDVSTVEGYARSFQSMIRKRGFDALMQRLREKLAEVEAEG